MPRVFARFPCRLAVSAVPARSRAAIEGTASNIGMGGAMVRFKGELPEGQGLSLQIECGGERFSVQAKVLRADGRDPKDPRSWVYGLGFVYDAPSRERVAWLVDRVRQGADAPRNPAAKDYWKR